MASFSGICSSSSALKLQNQSPRLTNLLRKELIAFPTGPKLASDRSWSQSVARDIPGELSSVNDRAIEKEKRGMKKHPRALWRRYVDWLCQHKELGLYIDVSRVGFTNEFLQQMEPGFQSTFRAMEELERGTFANPDEGCMVGHYWLRDSKRAPNSFLKAQIDNTIDAVCNFANDVVSGNIKPPSFPEGRFTQILSVGIGGSALGPQFVAEALAPDNPPLKIRFIDNTDPAGIDHQIAQLGPELG